MVQKSVFIRFLLDFAKQQGGKPSTDAMFAAIWVTLGWGGMKSKKITKNTLVRLPWYSRIYSTIVGVAASADRHGEDNLCGVKLEDLIPKFSFTRTAFLALIGREPSDDIFFICALIHKHHLITLINKILHFRILMHQVLQPATPLTPTKARNQIYDWVKQ